MTAQRQRPIFRHDRPLFRRAIAAIALLAAVGAHGAQPSASRAATTERLIVNRFSGLAIDGYDPVAYFVDGRPVLGLEDFEAWQGGVVWRFHNEGNRANFLAHPEIYGPQFGGYDPIDVARGVTVAGNPRYWVVTGERLYLFSREASRDAFAAHPERYLRQAAARWPMLVRQLSR
jgi:YHS domain-containing protein